MKKVKKIITILLFFIISTVGIYFNYEEKDKAVDNEISYEITNIPEYNGKLYIEINDNNPTFTDEELNIQEDYYSNIKNKRVRNGHDKNKLDKSK